MKGEQRRFYRMSWVMTGWCRLMARWGATNFYWLPFFRLFG